MELANNPFNRENGEKEMEGKNNTHLFNMFILHAAKPTTTTTTNLMKIRIYDKANEETFENVKTFILTAKEEKKKHKKSRNTMTMELRCELWPQTTKRDRCVCY